MSKILDKFISAQNEVEKVVKGKGEVVEKVSAAILAKGHVLLEDIPGVGKTTLAVAFSKVMDLKYKRIQFTPDVLPTDVTGFSMYNKQKNAFEYVEGGAMCNLFLADEINRTSPKTQSALLEVMEECKVTVDGITRDIPKPFFVMATQNPIGSVGTQKLPESQMDRFMVRLSMGYPSKESEIEILKGDSEKAIDNLEVILSAEDIIEAQKIVENITVKEIIYEYIIDLSSATRTYENIQLGLSPRGTIALLRMAKAYAFLEGRDYMIPEDVVKSFYDVSAHRIIISSKAKVSGMDVKEVLDKVRGFVEIPK